MLEVVPEEVADAVAEADPRKVLRLPGEDPVAASLRLNGPDLYRYVARRCALDDAADVVAEVFLTAWRRRDAVPTEPERARTWLFVVARRTLANHRRSTVRTGDLTARLRGVLATAVERGPASTEDGLDGVRDAVAALPAQQQELVRLVHWDGFSLTEAAELTGMRPSTARTHYARARERLAVLLARR